MKNLILFVVVFSAAVLLAACITTVVCAREVTTNVYYNYEPDILKITDTHYTSENGHVELKGTSESDGILKATFVSKSVGFDTVTFYTDTNEPELNAEQSIKFLSGPFGTLFIFQPQIDFEGSRFVIYVFVAATLVLAAVLLISFVRLIKKSEFSYYLVACGGVCIFCLHSFGVFVYNLIDSKTYGYNFGFGVYLSELVSSGEQFGRNITILMALFCTALIISNLSLIRHEGFRIQNLLGIILGVLWGIGTLANRYFAHQSMDDINHIYTLMSNGTAVIISYFECMLFSTVISAFAASRSRPPFDRDYIVILGCAIRKDGSLTPILRGRVDAAIAFAEKQYKKTGKLLKFVPSGGQGADEVISEGEAMKRYLLEQGIDEGRIIPETKSVNTFENIKLSKGIIEKDTREDYNAAFATTNYHIFRGYILSKKHGLKNARGISAKTKWYFFPNAFLREFAGLLADKRMLHLLIILLIIVSFSGIYQLTF